MMLIIIMMIRDSLVGDDDADMIMMICDFFVGDDDDAELLIMIVIICDSLDVAFI